MDNWSHTQFVSSKNISPNILPNCLNFNILLMKKKLKLYLNSLNLLLISEQPRGILISISLINNYRNRFKI